MKDISRKANQEMEFVKSNLMVHDKELNYCIL